MGIYSDGMPGFRAVGRGSPVSNCEALHDRDYWNHLNTRNPFTGSRIPEPGTVIYVDVSYGS